MYKQIIAPASMPAIGPYSPGVEIGQFLFCSGELPINPQSGAIVDENIAAATNQVMSNLQTVLTAAGLGMHDVVKTTIYLKNMDDFPAVNEVYSNHFAGEYPARTTIAVAALPKGASIEIDAIAVKPER
jgi:2-iminobutanoate/2-iminopropanoate deaminase